MGLQSAMTTALTGLQAAETTIDVVGNNVANSNTVGFKESDVNFATQFLQTQSVGGAPTSNNGGTNPRQIGLGVKVAEITPDFTQGTIEISSNPLDVAIQGDGFLIVQASETASERFYTRNGQLKTNANNEIVTVTGHRLLGFGVNTQNEIQTGTLTALTIPFGASAVAQATQNATLVGNLNALGAVESSPGVVQSAILSDGSVSIPGDFATSSINSLAQPLQTATFGAPGAGSVGAGTYNYKFVFTDPTAATGFEEGIPTAASTPVTVGAGSSIDINAIPTTTSTALTQTRIYRQNGTGSYQLVDTIASSVSTYTDTTADGSLGATLDESSVGQANYSYFATFYNTGTGAESRPTAQSISVPINTGGNQRIQLDSLPDVSGNATFNSVKIYRNTKDQPESFFEVAIVNSGTTSYIDKSADSAIFDLNKQLDRNGPPIDNGIALVNVSTFDGSTYNDTLFKEGTLAFTGSRGTATLATKELVITSTTTVAELVTFMEQALGIHTFSSDTLNPIPGTPGGTINGSRLQFTSNHGKANELDINLSAFEFTAANGDTEPVPLPFSVIPPGSTGESSSSEFIVYDSLGSPLTVKLSLTLEPDPTDTSGNTTRVRWFANSADNQPTNGISTSVGTGILTFDSAGRFFSATDATVQIERRDVAATSPVEFDLDFASLTALDSSSNLNLTNQDGFPAGSLTSFSITESGLIKGVFSNGTSRDIGQVQMARFTNSAGLEQLGDNLFREGVNSGVPITGDPGSSGLGDLTAGAVELSNTDIGQNLIELILASTQYRGNARVISAAQDLLDELMNLR